MDFIVKPEGFIFKLQGDVTVDIPSKYYPMPEESLMEVQFTGFSKIQNARILRIIDETPLKIGRCFENSQILHEKFLKMGFESQYFAGWMFPAGGKPIFHAWLVLLHQGEKFLIDSTYHKLLNEVLQKLRRKYGENLPSMNEMREEMAELFSEGLRKKKRNSDRIYTGTPMPGGVYVGCRSSVKEAFHVYQELIRLKEHPSYTGGMRLGSDSLFQDMVKNG